MAVAAALGGDAGDADDEIEFRPEFIGLKVVGGRVVGVDGGGGGLAGVPGVATAAASAVDLSHGGGGAGVSVGGATINGGDVGIGRLGSCIRQRPDQGSGVGLEKGAQGV